MTEKKRHETQTPEESLAPEETRVPEEAAPAQEEGATPEPQEETAAPAPEASHEAAEEAEPEDPQARLSALQQELESVRAQAQEYLDGWTRERAAFANYRRRQAEQQERQRQQLVAEVAKGFLEVLDDLERALQNRPKEGEGAAWAEGIELIYRKLRGVLEAQGVERVPAEPGMAFDPQYHEAISHEPVDGHESGHIIEVVRPGYRVGDLVIRPALVRVAQ